MSAEESESRHHIQKFRSVSIIIISFCPAIILPGVSKYHQYNYRLRVTNIENPINPTHCKIYRSKSGKWDQISLPYLYIVILMFLFLQIPNWPECHCFITALFILRMKFHLFNHGLSFLIYRVNIFLETITLHFNTFKQIVGS